MRTGDGEKLQWLEGSNSHEKTNMKPVLWNAMLRRGPLSPLLVNAAMLAAAWTQARESATLFAANLAAVLLLLMLLREKSASSAALLVRALWVPAALTATGLYRAGGFDWRPASFALLCAAAGASLLLKRLDDWCQRRFHWSLGRLIDRLPED